MVSTFWAIICFLFIIKSVRYVDKENKKKTEEKWALNDSYLVENRSDPRKRCAPLEDIAVVAAQ